MHQCTSDNMDPNLPYSSFQQCVSHHPTELDQNIVDKWAALGERRRAAAPTSKDSKPGFSLLTLLVPDVRFVIYNMLVREELFSSIFSPLNPDLTMGRMREGNLQALSRTCKTIRSEIELWYKHYGSRLSRMPEIGIFAPETTFFWLDCAGYVALCEVIGYENRQPELSFALWDSARYHLDRFWKHEACRTIQHLELCFRLTWHPTGTLRHMPYFEGFETMNHLTSIQVTFSHNETLDIQSVNAQFFWLDFFYRIWNDFWRYSAFCHPGRCCTCCPTLPEISVGIDMPWLKGVTILPALLPRGAVVTVISELLGIPPLNWYRPLEQAE